MYDHLGCPQTAAEFLSLRAIMLCSTTVMVSRRVEFTIIRLCVSHIGMLMQSFPSPDIEFRFSQPSIRALGDVEVPISVGNNLTITPVSPLAEMSASIQSSLLGASPTRVSISFSLDDWYLVDRYILCDRTRPGSRALSSEDHKVRFVLAFSPSVLKDRGLRQSCTPD